MKRIGIIVLLLAVLLLAFVGCERKVTNETERLIAAEGTASYIGSESCGSTTACHLDKWNTFKNTGHPYKLNEAEDVRQGGYYPFTEVPNPPEGVTWDDVDKVIGGFWWKARFIGTEAFNEGYIITGDSATGKTQYNLVDSSWSPYHAGQNKEYECGPCHMTAYKKVGNQEGKPHLIGTWEFNGVQCEECHGPGSSHRDNPRKVAMKVDRSSEGCGKCHIRGAVNKIEASGGFIRHHEQWNEMFTTKHRALDCTDCHDVHYSLHPSPANTDRPMAITVECESCHFKEAESFAASDLPHDTLDCVDCHMPKAGKSAKAAGTYKGDVSTHLWRINTSADAEMFDTTGAKDYANGYLTVEFACLSCHQDSTDTKAWAAANSNRIHAKTNCFGCHYDAAFGLEVAAIQEQYSHSVHASGENTNRNRNSASYYTACEKCHTSEGFIAEVTGIPASGEHFSPIGCFTCHKPHTGGNFDVRVQSAVSLANGANFDKGNANLCASCHQSRQNASTYVTDGVSLSSHWGPHHNEQADMLIGTNAYEYSGYTYSSSSHKDDATEGCIDCHMSTPSHSSIGGHSWNMENAERNWQNLSGCNVSTCHNGDINDFDAVMSIPPVDFDWNGTTESVHAEIAGLLDSLLIHLVNANLADTSGSPISRTVTLADSAGALYNYLFVEDDRSNGIHNTDYAVGLLQSSINYLATGDPNGVAGRRGLLSAH